jgi:hypothetical protein
VDEVVEEEEVDEVDEVVEDEGVEEDFLAEVEEAVVVVQEIKLLLIFSSSLLHLIYEVKYTDFFYLLYYILMKKT